MYRIIIRNNIARNIKQSRNSKIYKSLYKIKKIIYNREFQNSIFYLVSKLGFKK